MHKRAWDESTGIFQRVGSSITGALTAFSTRDGMIPVNNQSLGTRPNLLTSALSVWYALRLRPVANNYRRGRMPQNWYLRVGTCLWYLPKSNDVVDTPPERRRTKKSQDGRMPIRKREVEQQRAFLDQIQMTQCAGQSEPWGSCLTTACISGGAQETCGVSAYVVVRCQQVKRNYPRCLDGCLKKLNMALNHFEQEWPGDLVASHGCHDWTASSISTEKSIFPGMDGLAGLKLLICSPCCKLLAEPHINVRHRIQ
jgi:hypothetical protein